MTLLEYADELMRRTNGDGRAAVLLALIHGVSKGWMRAAPMTAEDVREFQPDPEPLDVATETSPHG